jgi:cytochrome c
MKCKLLLILTLLSLGCLGGEDGNDYYRTKVPHEVTPINHLEPNLREAVLLGKEVMEDKDFGKNGLACASCHPNPELNRIWPTLFPRKWSTPRNLDPKVITLNQHNYGAYREMMSGQLSPEDDSFTYLTSYLTWLGDGKAIWDEETPGKRLLIESATNGKALFNEKQGETGRKCVGCHSEESLEGIASIFPKYSERYEKVVILDTFLKTHALDMQGWELELEGQELADLSTFLTNISKGYVISLEKVRTF